MQMVVYKTENVQEFGVNFIRLMWTHHVVAILVWPYCTLASRAMLFVAWMLSSELSNILQNAFMLSKAGHLLPRRHETRLGLLWILTFTATRIVPAPWVAYAYYNLLCLSVCSFTIVERVVGLTTVPIPFVLNAWWYYELLKGAHQELRPPKGKKAVGPMLKTGDVELASTDEPAEDDAGPSEPERCESSVRAEEDGAASPSPRP